MMKAFVKLSSTDERFALVEVPCPEPEAGELLVRVKAIGVGIHDGYFLPPEGPFPYVIGIEAAGVVERVGPGNAAFQPGDRIAFISAMQAKGGTWAEYAVVDTQSLIIRAPDALSFETAAALPVAGNTILKAFRALPMKRGESLFIAGGSGAIGTLAIQLAAARGYKVLASSSPRNHDYMRSLGAETVVDYNDPDWAAQIRAVFPEGVDAAIGINPGTAAESQVVVKDGGTIVPISGDDFQTTRGIILRHFPYDVDVKDELEELVEQLISGQLKLTIEKVYPFAEAADALAKTATRRARGKVIVSLPAVSAS